ncbi:MAG: hypothetical protein B5M56_03905 [Desulfococcus sp. 4484_241]|nr:MAG: hypothetical protein B5M56_03905 [Desulfococcus sp. 4484_241]
MTKVLDRLVWLFAGVFGTHVGYYIYQTRYADTFAKATLSQTIAMIFEDIIRLAVALLDDIVPVLAENQKMIFMVLAWLVTILILLLGFRAALRIKANSGVNRKLKEADMILAEARKEAEAKIEEARQLKKRLIQEFKKKEATLNKTVEERLAEYKKRIKKIETERLELKEMVGELMRKAQKKQ